MKVARGGTRIVLIFHSFVIKLPKIPVFKSFRAAFQAPANSTGNPSILQRTTYTFLRGIRANRMEYVYSQKNKESEAILPVKGIMFGLVLIQKRNDVLDPEDSRWKKIVSILKKSGIDNVERIQSNNFCIIKNKPRILDYGDIRTQTLLDLYGQKIIDAYV